MQQQTPSRGFYYDRTSLDYTHHAITESDIQFFGAHTNTRSPTTMPCPRPRQSRRSRSRGSLTNNGRPAFFGSDDESDSEVSEPSTPTPNRRRKRAAPNDTEEPDSRTVKRTAVDEWNAGRTGTQKVPIAVESDASAEESEAEDAVPGTAVESDASVEEHEAEDAVPSTPVQREPKAGRFDSEELYAPPVPRRILDAATTAAGKSSENKIPDRTDPEEATGAPPAEAEGVLSPAATQIVQVPRTPDSKHPYTVRYLYSIRAPQAMILPPSVEAAQIVARNAFMHPEQPPLLLFLNEAPFPPTQPIPPRRPAPPPRACTTAQPEPDQAALREAYAASLKPAARGCLVRSDPAACVSRKGRKVRSVGQDVQGRGTSMRGGSREAGAEVGKDTGRELVEVEGVGEALRETKRERVGTTTPTVKGKTVKPQDRSTSSAYGRQRRQGKVQPMEGAKEVVVEVGQDAGHESVPLRAAEAAPQPEGEQLVTTTPTAEAGRGKPRGRTASGASGAQVLQVHVQPVEGGSEAGTEVGQVTAQSTSRAEPASEFEEVTRQEAARLDSASTLLAGMQSPPQPELEDSGLQLDTDMTGNDQLPEASRVDSAPPAEIQSPQPEISALQVDTDTTCTINNHGRLSISSTEMLPVEKQNTVQQMASKSTASRLKTMVDELEQQAKQAILKEHLRALQTPGTDLKASSERVREMIGYHKEALKRFEEVWRSQLGDEA
ncbi:hypothetical protein BJ508DRAFT_340805 [Ascobolus immersus RN42]|uniref:Uncharacterized protein n=1 Tax=Ascobolus immersus RN42 TaxID=1160509 RepID=A0A3N4HW76_ASCIM|nr:hypothetical protein BJ508DRAFT_340805 [Ascobolus immersus RN42]